MGFLKKLKDTAEKGIEKGTDLGKQGIEKGSELGKQGIDLSKKGVEKIDEIKETQKQIDDNAITKFLDPGEKILYSVSQKRSSGGGIYPIKIIVTDKKIITKDRHLMKPLMNAYAWKDISKLQFSRSLISNDLVISLYGAPQVRIEGLPKKETLEILDYGDKKIQEHKQQEPQSTNVDNDDPLTTLKKRFVKGEITKEEYEDMKQVLE